MVVRSNPANGSVVSTKIRNYPTPLPSCLVVLPNARRSSDRFVHCVLGVKWGGGHVAAPFVPMVVALVLNFLCTQYYSLREGG